MEDNKKKENKTKRRRGFTLIELLAVIVVLAILLTLTMPNIVNQVKLAKEKAFFTSVTKQVENIKADNVINNSDYCMYSYEDEEEKNSNIDNMFVIVYMENNDLIYSVYATKENVKTINIKNFSKINEKDSSEWDKGFESDSAYAKASELFQNINEISEKNYVVCGMKK